MRYRYYSTQRPLGPGTFPKSQGNKVLKIYNYDSRRYIYEIHREAWGFLEYEKPLSAADAAAYELAAGQTTD